jgi:hypothetical protein
MQRLTKRRESLKRTKDTIELGIQILIIDLPLLPMNSDKLKGG